ncbi:type II toxin-antitoxin system VapC family toxin [Caldinitratiruptor microaerophilus]|uniref:Ribonuclease VapC n=1 Tax=Caldinitratiruptor microaerophilus TaxID=671077 RepID=A0AA35CN27_9FIRM|nr:type II toxin-antitoxin system VapC family toxin [Caldinitratiruptor microaerophilus]BDG60386.1 twitching motility protein PilT [Caldinitratiruptor microaerophilus]
MRPAPAYLLDTDVIIWHLRGRPQTTALLQTLLSDGPLGCSALSLAEVLAGARQHELARTEALLDSLIALPVGAQEAKVAATLRRGRGPGFIDCLIAATAITHKIPLVTYNRRDFERTGARLFDTSGW